MSDRLLASATRLSLALCAVAGACDYDHDTVGAGYYGQSGSSAMQSTAPVSGRAGQSANSVAVSSAAGASVKAATTAPAATSSGGAAAVSSAGSGGVAAMSKPMDAGAAQPDAGHADAATTTQPTASRCDLSGRWLSTLHYATDALGAIQYCHTYLYYELAQKDGELSIAKALQCGDDGIGSGSLAASVEFKASRYATASKVSFAGRAISSTETSAGCQIDLAKWYTVRGATLPYYLDPANPMPTPEQPAKDGNPGWEDWDEDGNPGITGAISGVVTGKVFVAARQWSQLSGTVADVSTLFKLPLTWDQEQDALGYDGSPLLNTMASRAADASLHFAQFARLAPDQATGDDNAICDSVVALAPMLTPEAAGL